MANTTKHAFTSPKADGGDATLVRPSNWNAEHSIGIQLTNQTGGGLVAGDVVALDPAHDESVILADTQDAVQAYVVAQGTIGIGASGLFTQHGVVTVNVSAATTRGNYLAKASAAKALYDTGIAAGVSTPPPIGAVAIATTGSGGSGTVTAHLLGCTVQPARLKKGADIASAATITVPDGVNYAHVTGTTTITAIAARTAGVLIVLEFDGALQITHNASSLIMQGGQNYTTQAGEVLFFASEGSANWRQVAPNHAFLVYLGLGTNPASAGAVRLASQGSVNSRNAANSGDKALLSLDASDRVLLGPADATNLRMGGQVRTDLDTNSRFVLPVGTNKYAT